MSAALPLLSIVVPTRNRQHYAAAAVRALLDTPSDSLQVVVRDNSDEPSLEASIAKFRTDSRLIYEYVPNLVSSFENFIGAVRLASGKYIAVIGDDDVVNPEILAAAKWADSNGIDAFMSYAWAANYYWPDFRSVAAAAPAAGSLVIREFTGKATPVDPERELKRCLTAAGLGMQRLPKLYLGVVRRECVDETLKTFGNQQFGTCPDMFFSVALAGQCRKTVEVDYPLIVPGASSPSTAGDVAMKKHQGEIASAPHLRCRLHFQWPALIPKFYSYETFYAESALAALKGTRPDLLRKFNFPLLYLVCWRKYPEFKTEIARAYDAYRSDSHAHRTSRWVELVLVALRSAGQAAAKWLSDRQMRERGRVAQITYRDQSDSFAAMQALSAHLLAARISLDLA
jgi:hypothetical protein